MGVGSHDHFLAALPPPHPQRATVSSVHDPGWASGPVITDLDK